MYLNVLENLKNQQHMRMPTPINVRHKHNTGDLEKDIIYDNVDWLDVSKDPRLTEDFIRKHQDDVIWATISYNQTLSEDFIREFEDKVDWIAISYNQKLSPEFIKDYIDKLDLSVIIYTQELPDNLKEEISKRISYNDFTEEEYISY